MNKHWLEKGSQKLAAEKEITRFQNFFQTQHHEKETVGGWMRNEWILFILFLSTLSKIVELYSSAVLLFNWLWNIRPDLFICKCAPFHPMPKYVHVGLNNMNSTGERKPLHCFLLIWYHCFYVTADIRFLIRIFIQF